MPGRGRSGDREMGREGGTEGAWGHRAFERDVCRIKDRRRFWKISVTLERARHLCDWGGESRCSSKEEVCEDSEHVAAEAAEKQSGAAHEA